MRTRTDIALSLVGTHSMESEIDSRKLCLFGQFCRLRLDHWLRDVFLNRLTSFFMNGANQTQMKKDQPNWFIPDVVRLLEKYHLVGTLEVYRRDSIFPSKLSWKKTVKYKLREHELYLWHSRTSQPEFSRFHRVVPISQVHYFWILSKECHQSLSRHVNLLSR